MITLHCNGDEIFVNPKLIVYYYLKDDEVIVHFANGKSAPIDESIDQLHSMLNLASLGVPIITPKPQ